MISDKTVLLEQVLNESAVLDQREIDEITPMFQSECLKSGSFFIQEGMPVHKIAFVVSGILRRFTTNRNGHELIIQFITEQQFFGDLDGYFRQKPARANVQAISNCHLLTVSIDNLNLLRIKNPKFSAIIHFISNESVNERIKREQLINMGTPFEKFHHFLTHYSKWASRIPLKDVASYLQIRPNTLSYIGSQQLQFK